MKTSMNKCTQPDLNARLGDLCFTSGEETDREALEAHLLVCDECWTEFQRLTEAVHVLRAEGQLVKPLMAADLIELAGVASRLHKPFGGHWRIVTVVSVGFAAMMGLALPVEVAYEWATYGRRAIIAGPLLAAGSFVVSLLVFWFLSKRTREGDARATGWASLILIAWAIVVAVAVLPLLPNEQIVRAQFQTMTGALGWLKSTSQALALPLLMLLPYQMILALQRDLQASRTDRVLRILTGDPMRIIPRGSLFVRPHVAGFVALLFSVWWIVGTAHLLENLQSSGYLPLFMTLALSRASVAVLTLAAMLLWYVRTLDEIKREATAIAGGRSQIGIH